MFAHLGKPRGGLERESKAFDGGVKSLQACLPAGRRTKGFMEAKRSYSQLTSDVNAAAKQIEVGGVYRHYKNHNLYVVIGFAIIEATNEPAVLYRPQAEGNDLSFVRPVSEWLEDVEWNGNRVKRFSKADGLD